MTFDFFNTSYLAFGAKITKAFRSLGGLLDNAGTNIDILAKQLAYYETYMNKNYKVPVPSSQTSPVQTKQIYDVLSNAPIVLKELRYDKTLNKLIVSLMYFNPSTRKITYANGMSDENQLKGYCYLTFATSNDNPSTNLVFVTDKDDKAISGKTKLFKFDISLTSEDYTEDEKTGGDDGAGVYDKIVLSEVSKYLPITPTNFDGHYSRMVYKVVDDTHQQTTYEATGDSYMLIGTPYQTETKVSVTKSDGTTVVYNGNKAPSAQWNSYPIYLKDGESLTVGGVNYYITKIELLNKRRVE